MRICISKKSCHHKDIREINGGKEEQKWSGSERKGLLKSKNGIALKHHVIKGSEREKKRVQENLI